MFKKIMAASALVALSSGAAYAGGPMGGVNSPIGELPQALPGQCFARIAEDAWKRPGRPWKRPGRCLEEPWKTPGRGLEEAWKDTFYSGRTGFSLLFHSTCAGRTFPF